MDGRLCHGKQGQVAGGGSLYVVHYAAELSAVVRNRGGRCSVSAGDSARNICEYAGANRQGLPLIAQASARGLHRKGGSLPSNHGNTLRLLRYGGCRRRA